MKKHTIMKNAVQDVIVFTGLLIVLLSGESCKKTGTDTPEPGTPLPADSAGLRVIAEHLLFKNATTLQGSIPQGPAGTALKISFEDTLFLTKDVQSPIKFLHDKDHDVAGAYIQIVSNQNSGSLLTFPPGYFDVPEVKDTDNNDTVSVLMMGFKLRHFLTVTGVPPAGGNMLPPTVSVMITPYGTNKQPIASAIRPISVSDPVIKPDGTAGRCGLVLRPGDYWDWQSSYIDDGDVNYSFYNDPVKIWGKNGQDIKGSCCNGNSVYGYCPGDTVPNAVLHFNTFFNFIEEQVKFTEDGRFVRFTSQIFSNPAPDLSDYCGTGNGVVEERLSKVTYEGTWKVTPVTIQGVSDPFSLEMRTQSSTGGGYVNNGGKIRVLNCSILILAEPDKEIRNRELIKVFKHRDTNKPNWFPFE